jgi:hypothetical protein
MTFTFVPLSATSSRGRVTLVYAVDPLDPIPESKMELFQYPTSSETSVWATNQISVPTQSNLLFTRAGLVENTDLKTYDYGQVFLAISDTSETIVYGELFVDYTIELVTPKPSHCPASLFHISGTNLKMMQQFADPTGNNDENYKVYFPGGTWYGQLVNGSDAIVFTAPGTYLIDLEMGAATVGTLPTLLESTGNIVTSYGASGSVTFNEVIVVQITQSGQNVVFTHKTGWSGIYDYYYAISMFTRDVTERTGIEV